MNGKKQKNLENQKSARTHKKNMATTRSGKNLAVGTTMLMLQEMQLKRDNWILYMKKIRNNPIL
eukprot:11382913-Prorocentrum_lima.AAC.1